MEESTFMSVRDLAILLKSQDNTILSTIYKGKIPFKKEGKEISIDLYSLLQFMWSTTFGTGESESLFENRIAETEEDRWFRTPEAAKYLGISEGRLRNLTSEGKVPHCKLGRTNHYLKSALREHLLSEKRGGSHGN